MWKIFVEGHILSAIGDALGEGTNFSAFLPPLKPKSLITNGEMIAYHFSHTLILKNDMKLGRYTKTQFKK